jgi:hypothetical protein
MYSVEFLILFFIPVGVGASIVIAPLTLCIIRLLNETWLDKEWRAGRAFAAKQAVPFNWEQSIREFHRRQAPQCSPLEAAKSQLHTGIQTSGPSAFQERRWRF